MTITPHFMEHSNSKEKEVIVDIDSVEASLLESREERDHAPNKKPGRKISLNKLVSGVLGFKGSVDDEPGTKSDSLSCVSVDQPNETTGLLANQNSDMPPVLKDQEKERRKGGKGRKASKPPRPPKGPSLDAADMRLIKEISKIAMKKRERMERIKAVKKMKAVRSPSSPSSFSSSMGGTISAMIITVLFFLVLIFQGMYRHLLFS